MERFLSGKTLFAVLAIAALMTGPQTAQAQERSLTAGSVEQRIQTLSKIQPGLGTIMIEYGNRFVDVYFAARGGNWALAQYQLHEMTEAQEIGEITRPEHAATLKAFEDAYLEPLANAILKKDWNDFNRRYRATIEGCNECHAATGHDFIKFKLPFRPVEDYIDFSIKTDPNPKAK